jgi:hypothetical protein
VRTEERYLAWTREFCEGKEFQKWGHRWRARNSETGEDDRCSDTVEHVFEFEREDDGTLKLRGVWGAIWQMCS